jgi:hypothetical protein
MKTSSYKPVQCLLIVAVCLFAITSCKKDEETAMNLPRMFTPGTVALTTTPSQVTISWKRPPFSDGAKYTVEVSTDTLFGGTPRIKKEMDTLSFVVKETDVEPGIKYFARVRTNAVNTSEASNWAYSASFIVTGQPILLPVAAADLTPTSVILKWTKPNTVTHIMLNNVRYNITAGEATAGEKTITGLTSKVDYTAQIFNNNIIRGTQAFRTPANIPTGPLVVVVQPGQVLGDMLATAVDGNIFVLLEGTRHDYSAAVVLPSGISVTIFGEESNQKPILAFNGFTLPATAGTITFENVDITGYPENNPAMTKRNYIFNQSTASTTEKIVFENCTIRNFLNTPFRLQGSNPITVNRLVFNRCLVYDIGDNGAAGTYAFIHTNVAAGRVNNIEIKNSTLYKIGYSIILHNMAPTQSILIENCTFNNAMGDGRYFVDYNAQTVGSFTIRNCIIGKTLSPANTARGIRLAAASTYTTDNSYQTTDAVFAANPINGIISYSQASTNLFTDPANGNFAIKDNSFAGSATAGDPRWRP